MDPASTVAALSSHAVVGLVGFVANTLLVIAVLRRKRFQTPENCLNAMLAAADGVYAIWTVVLDLAHLFGISQTTSASTLAGSAGLRAADESDTWFTTSICQLDGFMSQTLLTASGTTLILISSFHYYIICMGKPRPTPHQVQMVMAGVWLNSIMFSIVPWVFPADWSDWYVVQTSGMYCHLLATSRKPVTVALVAVLSAMTALMPVMIFGMYWAVLAKIRSSDRSSGLARGHLQPAQAGRRDGQPEQANVVDRPPSSSGDPGLASPPPSRVLPKRLMSLFRQNNDSGSRASGSRSSGSGLAAQACRLAPGRAASTKTAAAPTAQSLAVRALLVRRAILITITFVVLWFTYSTLFFYQMITRMRLSALLDATIRQVVSLNAAMNPILFFVVEPRYRRSLQQFVAQTCGVQLCGQGAQEAVAHDAGAVSPEPRRRKIKSAAKTNSKRPSATIRRAVMSGYAVHDAAAISTTPPVICRDSIFGESGRQDGLGSSAGARSDRRPVTASVLAMRSEALVSGTLRGAAVSPDVGATEAQRKRSLQLAERVQRLVRLQTAAGRSGAAAPDHAQRRALEASEPASADAAVEALRAAARGSAGRPQVPSVAAINALLFEIQAADCLISDKAAMVESLLGVLRSHGLPLTTRQANVRLELHMRDIQTSKDARRVLDEMRSVDGVEPDINTYNILLRALVNARPLYPETLEFAGAIPLAWNDETFVTLMTLHTRRKEYDRALALFDELCASLAGPESISSVLAVPAKAPQPLALTAQARDHRAVPDRPSDVMLRKPSRNAVKAAMNAASLAYRMDLFPKLLEFAAHAGIKLDQTTLGVPVRALARSGNSDILSQTLDAIAARQLHALRVAERKAATRSQHAPLSDAAGQARKRPPNPDALVSPDIWLAVLEMSRTPNMLPLVQRSFAALEAQAENVLAGKLYAHAISAAYRCGDPILAITYYERMHQLGVKPSVSTLNTVLRIMSQKDSVYSHQFEREVKLMRETGVHLDATAFKIMMMRRTEDNDLEAVKMYFGRIKDPDSEAFLLLALAAVRLSAPDDRLHNLEEVCQEMERRGLAPTDSFYARLLSHAAKTGDKQLHTSVIHRARTSDLTNLSWTYREAARFYVAVLQNPKAIESLFAEMVQMGRGLRTIQHDHILLQALVDRSLGTTRPGTHAHMAATAAAWSSPQEPPDRPKTSRSAPRMSSDDATTRLLELWDSWPLLEIAQFPPFVAEFFAWCLQTNQDGLMQDTWLRLRTQRMPSVDLAASLERAAGSAGIAASSAATVRTVNPQTYMLISELLLKAGRTREAVRVYTKDMVMDGILPTRNFATSVIRALKARRDREMLILFLSALKESHPDVLGQVLPAWSYVTVSWMAPLLRTGFRKPLVEEVFTTGAAGLGSRMWAAAQASALDGFWAKLHAHRASPETAKLPSLVATLLGRFRGHLIALAALAAAGVSLSIEMPLMIPQLIAFATPGADTSAAWAKNAYAAAAILFAMQAASAMCTFVSRTITQDLAANLTSALVTAIYRKSLRLSPKAKHKHSSGQIASLASQDCTMLHTIAVSSISFLAAAVQIALALYNMSLVLGTATAVAAGGYVFFSTLMFTISPLLQKGYIGYAKAGDRRTKTLREFLYGIKAIKFHAIEEVFQSAIAKIRLEQLGSLNYLVIVGFCISMILSFQQRIVAPVSIIAFAALKYELTAINIFTALGLFADSPDGTALKMSAASFTWEEVKNDADALTHKQSDKKAAAAQPNNNKDNKNGDAESDKPAPFALQDITLDIPCGSLVAVVGSVGSGKSSLLSALIGGMRKTAGDSALFGSVAYCAQEPWIMSGTIEENIVFGDDAVRDRIPDAIAAACLDRDLEILPNGLGTQIGEKGINLSGGQKARVALARAIARDADIYLLDDPIAALDAHVGKQVFDDAICGVLRGKTVFLVTHQLHLLPKVDMVVVLDEGRVVETGAFRELMAREDGALTEIMKDYHFDDHDPEAAKETVDADEADGGKPEAIVKAVKAFEEEKAVAEDRRVVSRIEFKTVKSFFVAAGAWFAIAMLLSFALSVATTIFARIFLQLWIDDKWHISQADYLSAYIGINGANVLTILIFIAVLFHGCYVSAITLHDRALAGIMYAPTSFFDGQPIGRILNRMTADVSMLDNGLANKIYVVSTQLTEFIASVIVIGYSSLYLLIQLVVIASVAYALFWFYQRSYRELKRLQSIMRSPLLSHVSESLNGIQTIAAYGATGIFSAQLCRKIDLANKANLLFWGARFWLAIRLNLMCSTIAFAIGLCAAGRIIPPAAVGLALSSTISFGMNLNAMLQNMGEAEAMFNSVERLDYYAYDLPAEAARQLPTDPKDGEWPTAGAVTIHDLEIRYPSRPDHAVIQDLSLDIRPGEKVGVVGRTGSGKSTLMTALFRIMEASKGSIAIDGIDVASLGLKTLRLRLQIIPQDPVLFKGTVRSNLDFATKYSDNDLWTALDVVGLKDFVGTLDGKLDAAIEENGANLSMGQRQLMCLCKAILAKPKVLIMDEATASVDAEADRRIQESIETQFAATTVLSIAHRLNTIAAFDRVLVLDTGRIAEFDAPHVLLGRAGSVFGDMVDATGAANAAVIRQIAADHFAKTH
ncbi:hypothetical protein HK105_208469 [Polyrhizophydium stewartii]|uniref:Uncharacterized protein n=1 Tax=Polyrhizophydium stewartii TaxID=2732419 RepID=A0ABR4MXT3_9FUNG